MNRNEFTIIKIMLLAVLAIAAFGPEMFLGITATVWFLQYGMCIMTSDYLIEQKYDGLNVYSVESLTEEELKSFCDGLKKNRPNSITAYRKKEVVYQWNNYTRGMKYTMTGR